MIPEKLRIVQRTNLILKDKDGNVKEHREVELKNGVQTEYDKLTNKVIEKKEVGKK